MARPPGRLQDLHVLHPSVLADEDVCGLEVTVNEPRVMGGLQPATRIEENPEDLAPPALASPLTVLA